MADEQQTVSEQPASTSPSPETPQIPEAPQPKKSSAGGSVGSIIMAACMIVFGAAAWFGIGYLKVTLLEDISAGLLGVLTFGALLVGLIVGGIVGAKVKQLMQK